MDLQGLLIQLLLKMGVATAVASALGRSREFKKLLFRQHRSLRETVLLVLFTCVPFALGVYFRFNVKNFQAADLGFEVSILIGVMGGRLAGLMGGTLLAAPALAYGQYLTLPVNVLAGVLAGSLRHFCRNEEEIWTFSPFIDMSVYRWVKRNLRHPRIDWQTAFFLIIIALEAARLELQWAAPRRLWVLSLNTPWGLVFVFATVVATISIPIKLWNNARIEMKLEEQDRLLLEARLDALQSQINPHFLFNTLNSVSSLVRFDPDRARELIVKLSKLLRRLLGKHDEFVPLREEMEFVDDYLDIEVVRFGRDKLRVYKHLDPATLDIVVPSMLLQPLVENSIKHGLAPKVDGGSITLRSRVQEGKLVIHVEDDGVGMSTPPAVAAQTKASGHGIGMMNVAERLHVLFGDEGKMIVESRDGHGTLVVVEVPVLQQEEGAASTVYAARSNTRS
ncbi:MAG TPA: histidine kinase [Candidatus Angelobacter sp.]|jgi:two-component system LytT family sensor kinase|nr:histidine kinase [Candidatus Angelobacter sp.]